VTDTERAEAELDRDKRRWTIRRRITYVAMFLNVFIVVFYMFSSFLITKEQIDTLKEFNSIAITVIGGNFSVVLAYFGLNSYEDSHKHKRG